MRILLALVALLCLVCSIPVDQVPKVELSEEDMDRCDPDPCPANEEEEAPSLEDSQEVLLTAEETQEVLTVEANETVAEDELVEYNKWSGWLNRWDKPVKWCCGCKTVALDGIYSVHNNYYEDRRWQYHAQTYPRGMLARYQWWSGWTKWHSTWNRYRGDSVIVTIRSFHNNKKEDRRFRFLFRKINARAWKRSTWRWSGLNKYDGKVSKNCGTGWIMGLWSRYSKYHRDRQFNVLCGWIVRKPKATRPPTPKPKTNKTPVWVTKTKAVSKSTVRTNAVSVTKKK